MWNHDTSPHLNNQWPFVDGPSIDNLLSVDGPSKDNSLYVDGHLQFIICR